MKSLKVKFSKLSLEQLIYVGMILLIVAMPFHAFLATYLGSITHLGHNIQAWKEIIIVVMTIIATIYLFNRKEARPKLDRMNYLVVAIVILALTISLIKYGSLSALLFGIKTDLVPLLVFVIAQIVATKFDDSKVYNLIVWPAFIVSLLAILQALAIPPDLLSQLGYNNSTIVPAQYVDPTTMALRAFSTLGGPNQLGAYLILPITLVMARLTERFDPKKALILTSLLVGLYLTYSRSAWIGAGLAIIATILVRAKQRNRIKIVAGILISLVTVLLLFISRNFCNPNNFIQYYLLHGNFTNHTLQGSDQIRLDSLSKGLGAIANNPLGQGLGSAGPASYHALKSLITENWYLQIAIEIGLVGLALVLVFLGLNAVELLRDAVSQKNLASLSLFASLIGLIGTNMFLHSFSDSTLAIVFFAMMGIQHGRRQ